MLFTDLSKVMCWVDSVVLSLFILVCSYILVGLFWGSDRVVYLCSLTVSNFNFRDEVKTMKANTKNGCFY